MLVPPARDFGVVLIEPPLTPLSHPVSAPGGRLKLEKLNRFYNPRLGVSVMRSLKVCTQSSLKSNALTQGKTS